MSLMELRMRPHLSASAINDYCSCSLYYKFSRVDKLEREFTSDALVFGSSIHKALEVFHRARMMGGKLSQEEFIESFEHYWRTGAEDREDIQYKKGKNFQVLLNEGKALLRVFYEKSSDEDLKIIAVEESFSFSIDGLPLPVIGAVDVVLEDQAGIIIISDFKTSSKSYSAQQIDQNAQMTIYSMAARANGFADREILLRLDVLVKTKVPKYEIYYTVRDEEEMSRAAKKILAVYRGIQSEVFIPNDQGNWKCSCCEFRQACEQWHES
ncbi:RecB family exonuclease [Gemmatimonadota bacterium]